MTKYYYTDPLEAAWMSARFGMEFITLASGKRYKFTVGDIVAGFDAMGRNERFTYHIHPDSLHLLEPQKGDRIVYPSKKGLLVTDSVLRALIRRQYMTGVVEIIQRGGKPFFWPEVEP